MGYTMPSPTNFGALPGLQKQVIAFIVDPLKFAINRYADYRPAEQVIGLYMLVDSDTPVRIVDPNEFAWPEGTNRPYSPDNAVGVDMQPYICKRNNIGLPVGKITSDSSVWDVLGVNQAQILTRMMTLRSINALSVIDTVGNWGAFTATAQALSGRTGYWNQATNDNGAAGGRIIRKTINAAVDQVMLNTNNSVTVDQLRLIISPTVARAIVESDEMQDVLKQSVYANELLTGMTPEGDRNPNARFGLPKRLFDLEIVVEGAVYTDSRRTAAVAGDAVKKRVKKDQTAILCTKVGAGVKPSMFDGVGDGSDSVGESPKMSWSTYQIFHYGALLEAEQFPDVENRLTRIHVTENMDHKLAAPQSGLYITGIVA